VLLDVPATQRWVPSLTIVGEVSEAGALTSVTETKDSSLARAQGVETANVRTNRALASSARQREMMLLQSKT